MAIISAIASGNWNSTSTWSSGTIPALGDTIYLSGFTVTADVDTLNFDTLYKFSSANAATSGRLNVSIPSITINGKVSAGGSSSTTATVYIMNGCTSFTLNGDVYGGAANSNGIIRREVSNSACTIIINGSITMPSSLVNVMVIFYHGNTSTTAMDTYYINGNIIMSGYHVGSTRTLFDTSTSPHVTVIITGNVTYNMTTNGGTAGTMFYNNINGAVALTIVGNLYGGGQCYSFQNYSTYTSPIGLTNQITVNGNVSSDSNYPILTMNWNIQVSGTVSNSSASGGITISLTVGNTLQNVTLGSVIAPGTTAGVVSIGTAFNGILTVANIDCRPQTASSTNFLLSWGTTVPNKTLSVLNLYAGACRGIYSASSAIGTILIDNLYTNDSATIPTAAIQPGIDNSVAYSIPVVIKNMIVGNHGAWPIQGKWRIYDNTSKIYARDINGDTIEMNAAPALIIPSAEDVRFGVAVGDTVGTYQLSGDYLATITQLRTLALAIKSKSDQMEFTGTEINANTTNSGISISSEIQAIKAKTDQLNFETVSVTDVTNGDPSWTYVSALLHGDGTNGSTIFTDEVGHTFTGYGDTQISNTESKFGGTSIMFDGTGDYIDTSLSSDFGLGVGDWTLEAWIKTSTVNKVVFDTRTTDTPGVFYITSAGLIAYYDPILSNISGSIPLTDNLWHHIAWVRFGNSLKMFVDGALDGSATFTTQDFGTSRPLRVGADYSTNYFFNGFMDDIRITKGLARYVANFTLPIEPFPGQGIINTHDQTQVITSGVPGSTCNLTSITAAIDSVKQDTVSIKAKTDQLTFSDIPNMIPDPTNDIYWSNVVLASHFYGANTGTTFTELTGKDISYSGTVTTSSTQKKFGTSSAYFNGSGNLLVTDSTDFILGTGDFTVELWFYKISGSSTTYQRLVQFGANATANGLWIVANRANGNECLPFVDTFISTNYISPTGWGSAQSQDAWHHLAVTRHGSLWTIYIDGLQYAQGTYAGYEISSTTVYIGGNSTGSERFYGYIDDIRITKGIARYTAPFAVSTSEFETYSIIQDGIVTAINSNTISGSSTSIGTSTCDLSSVNSQLSLLASDVTEIKGQTDKMEFDTVTDVIYTGDPNWSDVTVLLYGDGANNSTTITDEKSNTITVSGNTKISTIVSKFDGASINFDGTGDYLTVSNPGTTSNFGSSNFTIEAWVYWSGVPSSNSAIFSMANTLPIELYRRPASNHALALYAGSNVITGTTPITSDAWHHVAITRVTGTTYLWLDGVLEGSTNTSINFAPTNLIIGSYTGASEFFNGYIDNFRITKNVARYTQQFLVPTEKFPNITGTTSNGDTHNKIISTASTGSVDLLPVTNVLSQIKAKTDQMNFNSGAIVADISAITASLSAIDTALTNIEAVTSKIGFETVTSEGDPNLALVVFKAEYNNGTKDADTGQVASVLYGNPAITGATRTGTGALSVSTSALYYPSSEGLILGASDFTIEFSVMFSVIPGYGIYGGIISKILDNSSADWLTYISDGKIAFSPSGTNVVSIVHPVTIVTGTWYDIAISRTAGTLKMFINGVVSQVSCAGMSISNNGGPIVIGRVNYFSNSSYMDGIIDRIRITKGIGRYSSVDPVSPPTSVYPTTTGGTPQSYKVVANCDNGATIPTDLTDRLNDLRNRINAIHFIVKDE